MDGESRELSHRYYISLQTGEENGDAVHQAEVHEMHCIVCGRTYIPCIGVNEDLDSMTICRDCKSLVMDDNDSSFTTRNYYRSQGRRTSAYGSPGSVENALSQQFSQLIEFVQQNHDSQLDDDVTVSGHQRSSYSSFSNWPRRVRRPLSETDNESVDIMGSLFGETDSHISFVGYGGDSDASVDGRSIVDRETPSPLDFESRIYTDTDIDPMHAGLDQWTSDDPSEYGELEDGSTRDASVQFMESNLHAISPNGSASIPQIRWRVRQIDLFTDLDEVDLSPFTGNSGDYMDAQGFEELLEQLAEADSSRIGAPPAAASSLQNLPCVIVSKDHEKNGALICAVCKDPLFIDSEAKLLPCSHLYHPSCILPWLRTRNSCPVCRYELPTDDPDYEKGKQDGVRNGIRNWEVVENYSDRSSDVGDEANEHRDMDVSDDVAGSSNHRGNRRWFLIAAAPIVAIVGIAVAALLRNSMTGQGIRIHHVVRDRDMQSQRSQGVVAHGNRSRSWSLH